MHRADMFTVFDHADIADDEFGARNLSDVSSPYDHRLELSVELALEASELEVLGPVDDGRHQDDEDDGEHDSDALNGTRRALGRVSYTNNQSSLARHRSSHIDTPLPHFVTP